MTLYWDSYRLGKSWREPLAETFASQAMGTLATFLAAEQLAGKAILPSLDKTFRALELTAIDEVQVVILGQDPYHGDGQAQGLAFSVSPGVRIPPSLNNIYKELHNDLGIAPARHGCLEHWARQGVLLLNSVLSVEQSRAASHQGQGWEAFTDTVIRLVAAQSRPSAFLLWGNHALKKAECVDPARHLVLRAPHPSPLSAHRGFIGCRHFSQTNDWLKAQGRDPIDWRLPESSR